MSSVRILVKSYNEMTEAEKHTFWYGYWEKSFYDKAGKAREHGKALITSLGCIWLFRKRLLKSILKTSKEMITCPICEGTVLNHHKKLKFGDTDIREIINQPLDQVLKTVGDLPVLEKLKSIVAAIWF